MTMIDDAKDKIAGAIDGAIGRIGMAAAVTIILALSGWAVKTTGEHSTDLAAIHEDVKDLIALVQGHNASVDSEITRMVDSTDQLKHDVARLQQAEETRERFERDIIPHGIPERP